MTLARATIVLSFIMPLMADQNTPVIFPMETISCALERASTSKSASDNTLRHCNAWRTRMKEEGFSAVKCQDVKDVSGREMWACTPKWIRQKRNNNDKTIFMKYFISKNKAQNLHMHAVIDYPETKLLGALFPIMILAIMVLACCCMAHMDPQTQGSRDNDGLSFGDAFLAASLANSWHDSDSSGPAWGGEDYSYKCD